MPANFMGFGTSLMGKGGFRADGSYVTTEFLTAGWLPVLPLRSFRVRPALELSWQRGVVAGAGLRYQVLERFRPLCWSQVTAVYWRAALFLAGLLLLAGAALRRSGIAPLEGLHRYAHGPVAAALVFFLALPLCLCAFLLLISRRRPRPSSGRQ